MFIERGVDLETGSFVAQALSWYPRVLVRVLKPYFRERPELQLQANMALRHFAAEGDLAVVSLLLWLGANPRAKAPEKEGEPEDQWLSAMTEAVWKGHMKIVEKFGLDPEVDDLNDLLGYACMSRNSKMVEQLIRLGADPNYTKPEWQSPLQWALWSLSCQVRSRGNSFGYGSEAQLEIVRTLAHLGARLPGDKDTVQEFRSVLLNMSWYKAFEFIKDLRKQDFASDNVWSSILRHAKIREHLKPRAEALERLFPGIVQPRARTSDSS